MSLRRVLQAFIAVLAAIFSFTASANTCMGIVTLSMHANFCASLGAVSCGYNSGTTSYASFGCASTTTTIGAGYCAEPQCAGMVWGVVNSCPAGQIPDTNGLCFLDCAPGTHESNGACVPDPVTCPEHQTDVNGTCTPDTPEPSIGEQGTQPVVAGTCQSFEAGNCVLDPQLLAGGSLPANCGGWSCAAAAGNATSPAKCYQISSAPTSLFCDFNPVYSGGGPYVGNSTLTNGTQQSTTVCPSGSVLGADGLCHSGQSSGTATSLTGSGTAGQAGTASCPVGSTLEADGRCYLSTSTGTCPAGFTAGTNGTCSSVSTIGQDGRTSGGGTSATGVACGAPGQPACTVKIDPEGHGPADAANINSDKSPIDAQTTSAVQQITNWLDPAYSTQMSFRDMFTNWIGPISVQNCSPWVATISGNTWTVDFCSKASVIASWLEYVMWFLFIVSTFKLLTTRYP